MPHQHNLPRLDNNHHYERLHYKKPSPWLYPFKFISAPFKLACNLVGLFVGRLVSQLVFNPHFRAEAKKVQANTRHFVDQDAALDVNDDPFTIDVTPSKSFWHRFFSNIAYRLRGDVMRAELLPFDTNPSTRGDDIKNRELLDTIIGKVTRLTKGTPVVFNDKLKNHPDYKHDPNKTIAPSQIHLKGLEHLSEPLRNQLLQELSVIHDGHDFEENRQRINYFTLRGRGRDELDSVEVIGKDKNDQSVAKQAIAQRTFIVSCMPRSNNYHLWFRQFRYYSNQLNTTVVSFNYRGTGTGKGLVCTQGDMVKDAIMQVERLLAKGARPENIALDGECLGAAIATLAAAKLHQRGYPVNLYNARSFRSTTRVAAGKFIPQDGSSFLHPKNWLKALGFGLMYLLMPVVFLFGWELNANKAYASIPYENKTYLTAHGCDGLINSFASIESGVKERQAAALKKQTNGEKLSPLEQHLINDRLDSHHASQAEGFEEKDGHTCQPKNMEMQADAADPEQADAAPKTARAYKVRFFHGIFSATRTQARPSQQTTQVL